jgi:hypothetical protein
LRAFQEGNSCLLSPGAPNSPVHHRTLSGAPPDTVRCGFLSFFGEANRWRFGAVAAPDTVRCTPDSLVPPSDRWLGHVSRTDRAADRWPGRPLAHRTVWCTPDSPVNYSRTPLITFPRAASSPEPAWRNGHCSVHHRTVRCTQTEQTLAELSHLYFRLDFSCFQHLDTIH